MTASSSSSSSQAVKKKKIKSPPPWQVLSAKDAKTNVQKEKIRRQLVNAGQLGTHESIQESESTLLSKQFLDSTARQFFNWKPFRQTTVTGSGLRFVGIHRNTTQVPALGVPQVAFLGRSNVGKSSLLNRLAGAKAARVGKTPGATASVNVYELVDDRDRRRLGLVDLPGFGYARLSKSLQAAIQAEAEDYLDVRSEEIALAILLVDLRRTPTTDDRAVLAALYDMGLPVVVVATKLDKVAPKQREERSRDVQKGLGLPDGQPLCVSTTTGDSCKLVWRIIMEACEVRVAKRSRLYQEEEEDASEDASIALEENDLLYDQGFDWVHAEDQQKP